MTFIKREDDEPLAMHLYRNADALGVDVEQRARLRQAAALCQRGSALPRRDTAAGREDRAMAGQIAAQVRDELKRANDAVVYAAQARGEKVSPHKDAMRIKSRDGLWTLVDTGTLPLPHAEALLGYRALHERVASSPLGSQLGNTGEVRVVATSTAPRVRAGLHAAYAGVKLTDINSAVMADDPSGLALRVLIAVAGEGHTIGSLATSGHMRSKMTKALIKAAAIVADRIARHLVLTDGGLRITGS